MEKEFVVRILVATVLGALIGLDREYRTKAAGFRTHCMVALGSALFMIVSAYGFKDVMAAGPLENIRLDVSRIAAQVVTGIGFIGAGAIIIQKKMVRGLTTAAGLWVTSAIGLACGAGMYLLATVTALLVLLCYEGFNMFLHKIRGKGDEEEMHKDEE